MLNREKWRSHFVSISTKFVKLTEAVVWKCSVKIGVLRNFENLQENTCVRVSFFNKVAGLRPATLWKKKLWHRCFPVNYVRFLRTPFLTEYLRWLLLNSALAIQDEMVNCFTRYRRKPHRLIALILWGCCNKAVKKVSALKTTKTLDSPRS